MTEIFERAVRGKQRRVGNNGGFHVRLLDEPEMTDASCQLSSPFSPGGETACSTSFSSWSSRNGLGDRGWDDLSLDRGGSLQAATAASFSTENEPH